MLKQGSFIKRKYRTMMVSNVLLWGAYCLNVMLDAILGGNRLGETALTAVSIVAPIFYIESFLNYPFTPGYAALYGKYNGQFDTRRSYGAAGQGLISSAGSGILIAVLLFLLKEPFLSYYHCTGELYENASVYYNCVILYSIVHSFNILFYYLVMVDGDAFISMCGSVAEIAANLILSLILCRKYGILGLGAATVMSAVLDALIHLIHFLRRKNSIRFRLHFDFGDMKEAFRISISRCLSYIFKAAVDITMNKVILTACGILYVPAYSVINLAFIMFEMFGAAFDSSEGLLTSFLGERNNYGIRRVMGLIGRTSLILGAVLSAAFFFGAPLFPKIYGMTTPECVEASVKAARVMALAALPYGVSFLFAQIYATLDRPGLSILIFFLNKFLCPLLLAVPGTCLFGFTGAAVGMALSAFLAAAVFILAAGRKFGFKGFPLYLEDYGEEYAAFDLRVTRETIPVLRDSVSGELKRHSFEIRHADLLIEELYTRILEKNPQKAVISECALMFGPSEVRIIVRDDGEIFNFADENNAVESLNAHVLMSLLETIGNKDYILTTSFNRNGFIFEKKERNTYGTV